MSPHLKDLKVIELAGVLAGPAVGTFFAEMGAEVLKIESPKGDVTRTWKTTHEPATEKVSAYFSSVNYGKKYLTLDFTKEEDLLQLYTLIEDADIVITNYKKGDDVKLGVDYASLKKLNPTLIYAAITGYGNDSDRTAFDAVLQAETGFMSMNGTPESGPLKMPVALIDVLAAHQLKEGILVALLHKLKTGKGAFVSVSLFDAAVASLMNQASNWLMTAEIPVRQGSLHPNIAPYGETYKTADGKFILLAVGNDAQFHSLCADLGLPDVAAEPKFSTNQNRLKYRAELNQLIKTEMLKKSALDWHLQFGKSKIPHGVIKNLQEVFNDDQAASLVKTETIQGKTTKRVKNTVFKIKF